MALDQILARANKTLSNPYARSGEVSASADFRRIEALPRRPLDQQEEKVEALTQWLRTPTGTMRLLPSQALALCDLYDARGCFLSVPVGGGKTLISLLAPTVMEAKRPLLLVPGKVVELTETRREEYARHWRVCRKARILSYQKLSRHNAEELLESIRPDLIVADEVHYLKNRKAACTRKLSRYMKKNPETVFCGMSGTITSRSIQDYAHIARWVSDNPPVPLDYWTLIDWSSALDVNVRDDRRMGPGVLLSLTDRQPGELEIDRARRGYSERLFATPGFVRWGQGNVDASLRIETVHVSAPKLEDHFRRLHEDWVTPDEHPIADGLQKARHARELGLGFFYRWNPRPPREWLNARSEWAAFVRKVIATNRRGIDSEQQVAMAYSECAEYRHWSSIREHFVPNTEAVWVDDTAIEVAKEWIRKHRGLVWVEHIAFGERLSAETGVPYYRSNASEEIERQKKTIILSLRANKDAVRLTNYSKNLVMSPASSGKIWEQQLGRTHRRGQEADEVTCDVMLFSAAHLNAWQQAQRDAKYIQDTLGSPQKLCYADIVEGEPAKGGSQWA